MDWLLIITAAPCTLGAQDVSPSEHKPLQYHPIQHVENHSTAAQCLCQSVRFDLIQAALH